MGKQAVSLGASIVARGGFHSNDPWTTPGFINGDSTTNSGLQSFVIDGGTATANGQTLIDGMGEISSSTTKSTEIHMKWLLPVGQNQFTSAGDFTMSIFIDWSPLDRNEDATVRWSGQMRWPTSNAWTIYAGKSTISSLGSDISLSASLSYQNNPTTPILKTGSGRNILSLPAPVGSTPGGGHPTTASGLLDGLTTHGNYMVTTDDGINVSATPTPPAETPTVEVSGIKISELSAVSALQDDDLFVLSQDNASDGTYDASYNVTLTNLKTNLKTGLSTSFQSGKWVAGDTLSISTTNVTSCGISIATGLTNSTDSGHIMGKFDVSSKSLKLTQVYNGGAGSAPAVPEDHTLTLDSTLQDMNIQPGSNGVIVKAKFDANTLYIELTGTDMRGTYLIALS